MFQRHTASPLLVLANLALLCASGPALAQAPLGTGFTYQGQLGSASGLVDGSCDLNFGLFATDSDGAALSEVLLEDVEVRAGRFSVELDFGPGAFPGSERWLEIEVRCPATRGDFTNLSPRQALTAAPYALWTSKAGSAPWSGLTGMPNGFADGTDDGFAVTAGDGLELSGGDTLNVTFSGSGSATSVARGDHGHQEFLRKDQDSTFTKGTLTLQSGTTLEVEGSISLPSNAISDAMVSNTLTASSVPAAGVSGELADAQVSDGVTAGTVPASGVTGTLSDAQVSDTLTASIVPASGISGTITDSQVSDTLTASAVPATGITGSITDAQVSNTLTSSDLVAVGAVVSDGEVEDTITLTNITQITNRALASTTGDLDPDRLSGDSTDNDVLDGALIGAHSQDASTVTGTITDAQVSDTLTASIMPASGISGSITDAQVSDTLTASTVPAGGITGTISDSQVSDTLTASTVTAGGITGTIVDSQVSDTLTASTVVATGITGTIADVQVSDDLTASVLVAGNYRAALDFDNSANRFKGDGSRLTNLPVNAGRLGFAPSPGVTGVTTLDSAGDVGEFTSITIGSDGLGLIAYWDRTNFSLKTAHCDDAACSSASTHTLHPGSEFPGVGPYASIIIGADGLGLISYYDALNGDLRVAHCNNVECSSASIPPALDGFFENVGIQSSITIGGDGLGLISYYDATNADLKVAHCNDLVCSSASINTIDSAGDVGQGNSITTQADGLGLISYLGIPPGNKEWKVAHCLNAVCSVASTYVHSGAQGTVEPYFSSITTGVDGNGLFVWKDLVSLHVAGCATTACETYWGAGQVALANPPSVGQYNSITVGADGLGLISYYDAVNADLKLAHCNADLTLFSTRTVDSAGDVGRYTSVTLGPDGLPLISYYDATNQDLKVAHLSNPWGAPFLRRR